ncbi:MAG: cation:proton antiporter [Bacteroidales bacterium]|nr:cation:proton antiporter [Bacteroidales bacterium]
MDPIWLTIAFTLGFLVRLIGLPPLIGYLIAGFVLNYFGAEPGEFIKIVSDLGVTLLLFTIGLKLKIKNLLRKEIWAGSIIHMILTTLVFALLLLFLSYATFDILKDFNIQLALIIAFALSFSSTIFAVKILENNGEINSPHGVLSIGILIMQDIFAVLFIVFATGEVPSIWVLVLPLALFLIRPILIFILKKIGHGELLILFGFFLALIVGAELFKFVGLKADLGALAIGMLIANHKKSKELADTLLNFKDFFLIGFFLSIGFLGIPTKEILIIGVILALGLNFKIILYLLVLTRFKLRARTSVFTSLTLANYSEFGLIVASYAAAASLISSDWIVAIAIALSITFVISSPLNTHAHSIYYSIKDKLQFFERHDRLEYDKTFDIGNAQILIFGLGKLGSSVYEQLYYKYGQSVIGLDYNLEIVEKLQAQGKNVVQDDATDSEFWERIANSPVRSKQVKAVMLCMNDHKSNMFAVERLKAIDYEGLIAATAVHDDEIKELENLNIHSVYNLYSEAGFGFADHACQKINEMNIKGKCN